MLSADLFTAITNKTILNQRFATDLNEQTNAILSDMAKWIRITLYDYESIFGETITPARKKRLDKLLATVTGKLDEIYQDIDDLYIESFRGLSSEDANFIAQAIDEDLLDNLVMNVPSDQRLWAAVTQNPLHFPDDVNNPYVDFVKMVKSLGEKSTQIANTISAAYFSGQTVQETVSQIVGTRKANYRDGMVDKSRRDAERVVRTATNHVTTQARARLYEDNEDIVYGYRIVATIDTRTSTICKTLDGKVVKLTARVQPLPPFHPNCRTTTVPEIYGQKLSDTAATRAVNFKARGDVKAGTVGQVSAQNTYLVELKKQPAGQQDIALGPIRGKIFRNAGLTTEEFKKALADNMGRPLTLAEMARQNKKILEYMRQSKELSRYLDD
tara:strand:- start:961 stop:2115 length:1155 start_codon:yes stop_codon:yes gene_type:complete